LNIYFFIENAHPSCPNFSVKSSYLRRSSSQTEGFYLLRACMKSPKLTDGSFNLPAGTSYMPMSLQPGDGSLGETGVQYPSAISLNRVAP